MDAGGLRGLCLVGLACVVGCELRGRSSNPRESSQSAQIPDLRTPFLEQQVRRKEISHRQALAADWALSSTTNPLALKDPAVLSAGKEIFSRLCAECHGPRLDGQGSAGIPIRNVNLLRGDRVRRWDSKQGQWARYFGRVAKGKKRLFGKDMPAFADYLAREQIWQVVTYIRHTQLAKQE